jgi:hypothetical protein
VIVHSAQALSVQTPKFRILGLTRKESSLHPLTLNSQHHHSVETLLFNCIIKIVVATYSLGA